MERQIVIQNDSRQMQVAVLEDGRLADYFVQRNDDHPVAGSFYRGVRSEERRVGKECM